MKAGRWGYAVQPEIEGVAVSLPVIELVSVGVGGGSIVRSADGTLTVGPDSVGAQPGPACFGLGGTEATVTDAALVLGILDPGHYLGGRKRLDADLAAEALARVGEGLGLDAAAAARLVLARAAALIAEVIRDRLHDEGLDPAATTLFAIGGAGGLVAALVARDAALGGAVAFPLSPVFSAFGLSRLDIQHAYDIAAGPVARMRVDLADARERARRDMAGEGVDPAAIRFGMEAETVVDGRVVVTPIEDDVPDEDALHRGGDVRMVRLRACAAAARSELPRHEPGAPGSRSPGRRLRLDSGTSPEAPVHDWDAAEVGARIAGPALVESDDTTVLVPAGFLATVGALGELRIGSSDGAGRAGAGPR